jgi:hypothetical protein
MLLLTDGSVPVHNGYVTTVDIAKQWLRLSPDSAGHYDTGEWSGELNMTFGRQWFASGVLDDGRLFVIGGEDCSDPLNSQDAPTGELFDPMTNLWSDINKPPSVDFVRGYCNGSVLADSPVFSGGANSSAFRQTKRSAIWDPKDGSWFEAGLEFGAVAATTKADPFEEKTWALLPDKSVLAPAVVKAPPPAQRSTGCPRLCATTTTPGWQQIIPLSGFPGLGPMRWSTSARTTSRPWGLPRGTRCQTTCIHA